jgi:hypothetical protein
MAETGPPTARDSPPFGVLCVVPANCAGGAARDDVGIGRGCPQWMQLGTVCHFWIRFHRRDRAAFRLRRGMDSASNSARAMPGDSTNVLVHCDVRPVLGNAGRQVR